MKKTLKKSIDFTSFFMLSKYVKTRHIFTHLTWLLDYDCASFLHLQGRLHLSGILGFSIRVRVNRQNQLHFLTRRGDGHFINLGKALADVHKGFIFGFREDDIEVYGSQNADCHKHKEGKGLQRLLCKQKTHRQETWDISDLCIHCAVFNILTLSSSFFNQMTSSKVY